MRKLGNILLLILLLSALRYPLNATYASVPHLLNYQGRLTDTSGVPLNGLYNITFRIYDAEAAGNLLWQGTYTSVPVSKGIFNILLGDISDTGFNFNSLAFDKPYWLEIKVGTDDPMQPRQRITSAGYAIRAEKAEDANKVANVSVNPTPQANKLLPLDATGKFPIQVIPIKIYDSGWFLVAPNSSYTKMHNLGTTKIIAKLYFATDNSGSNMQEIVNTHYDAQQIGALAQDITQTSITVVTARAVTSKITNGVFNPISSGYIKIIIFALE